MGKIGKPLSKFIALLTAFIMMFAPMFSEPVQAEETSVDVTSKKIKSDVFEVTVNPEAIDSNGGYSPTFEMYSYFDNSGNYYSYQYRTSNVIISVTGDAKASGAPGVSDPADPAYWLKPEIQFDSSTGLNTTGSISNTDNLSSRQYGALFGSVPTYMATEDNINNVTGARGADGNPDALIIRGTAPNQPDLAVTLRVSLAYNSVTGKVDLMHYTVEVKNNNATEAKVYGLSWNVDTYSGWSDDAEFQGPGINKFSTSSFNVNFPCPNTLPWVGANMQDTSVRLFPNDNNIYQNSLPPYLYGIDPSSDSDFVSVIYPQISSDSAYPGKSFETADYFAMGNYRYICSTDHNASYYYYSFNGTTNRGSDSGHIVRYNPRLILPGQTLYYGIGYGQGVVGAQASDTPWLAVNMADMRPVINAALTGYETDVTMDATYGYGESNNVSYGTALIRMTIDGRYLSPHAAMIPEAVPKWVKNEALSSGDVSVWELDLNALVPGTDTTATPAVRLVPTPVFIDSDPADGFDGVVTPVRLELILDNPAFVGDTGAMVWEGNVRLGRLPSVNTALRLNGLGSVYVYGDEPFEISTMGGEGDGEITYESSDTDVAAVENDVPEVDKGTVAILKAGEFKITATKAAQGIFARAVAEETATVIEATPNISLDLNITSTSGMSFIVSVDPRGCGAIPEGTVEFYRGEDYLGEGTLIDGTAIFTGEALDEAAEGIHTYSAVYSGQAGYYTSNSIDIMYGPGLLDQNIEIRWPEVLTYGDGGFAFEVADSGVSTGAFKFYSPANNGVLTVTPGGEAAIIGAGSVTVTVVREGNDVYNGVYISREITVLPRDISNVNVDVLGEWVYTGNRLRPMFNVDDGEIYIDAGDYTNVYGENINAGVNAGEIILYGQRNYTGTKTVYFDIAQTLFNLDVTAGEGGRVSGTATGQYEAGTVISVTATPDSGYSFAGWIANGVTLGNNYAITAVFYMPHNNITLTANFTYAGSSDNDDDGDSGGGSSLGTVPSTPQIVIPEQQTPLSPGIVNPFTDVKESDWFYKDVMYVFTHGFMVGTASDKFSPQMDLTRAMIVTVLYRYSGEPKVSGLSNPFNDVPEGAWYTNAVKWGAANNIIYGYGNGKFGPNDPITRQDLTAILWRYANSLKKNIPPAKPYAVFSDETDISDYAKKSVETFFRANIVSGYPDGSFKPKSNSTRAEFASILQRFVEAIK